MGEYDHIPRDLADWPKGLDDETKAYVLAAVVGFLVQVPNAPLHVIYSYVTNHGGEVPDLWRRSIMLDWRYAVVERALRKVAVPVWRLENPPTYHAYYEDSGRPVFKRQPRAFVEQLSGDLPDAKALSLSPDKTNPGTLSRTDGGDVYERARYRNKRGKAIIVARE